MTEKTVNNRVRALTEMRDDFAWRIEHYGAKLADFAERFEASPANAFEWAGSAYGHAAEKEVAEDVVELLERAIKSEDETTLEDVANRVMRNALRRAASSSRSTSGSCNLINDERVRAWASAARMIRSKNL